MSSDRQLHFEVNQRRAPGKVFREITLKVDGESESISILYEIFDTAVADLTVLDGLVQGVLFHCMRRGLPLRIHGNLSTSSFRNLHEFQRAWVRFRPQVYRHIDLIPDTTVTESPRSDKIIQAFSGGVDSSFTLISNKYLHKQQGGFDIAAALLVHGFDVSYDNRAGFDKLVERVRKTLDHFGVELKIVRTNSKTLNLQSWMDSFGLQLTACLHQFFDRYGTALMASAKPYDALWMPVSSNPITDQFLSGDLMTIVHDGGGYSRMEKVEAIAKFPILVDQLKVCWEGRSQHENCGSCEKCLRTRLNFAAAGYNEPSCFPGAFNKRMLRKLRAATVGQLMELENILTYVRRRHFSYPWLISLRRQIMLSRLAIAIKWPAIRAMIRTFLRALTGKTSGIARG